MQLSLVHAGVRDTVNVDHIKVHYFTSHQHLNYFSIVPKGGEPWWEQPAADRKMVA
jgi:putative glutathione S-transferase